MRRLGTDLYYVWDGEQKLSALGNDNDGELYSGKVVGIRESHGSGFLHKRI